MTRLSWLLLAMVAFAADEPSEPAVVKGADMALLQEVRRLAVRVEDLRGVPFDRQPVAVRAEEEARRLAAEKSVAGTFTEERLAARGRAWEDLGLGTSGAPATVVRVLAADLAGASLDRDGNRLLVDPGRLTDEDFGPGETTPGTRTDDPAMTLLLTTGIRPDEPLLAHLLVHGLQAERGDAGLPETTDAMLAARSWAEGEANLLAVLYLFRSLGLERDVLESSLGPDQILGGALLPAGIDDLPGVARHLADFVYRDGYAQAVAVLRQGGFTNFDRQASSRPTTRDLLHLDREPLSPYLPDPPDTGLPDAFALADTDVLGEQAVVVLVSNLTGKINLGLMAGDGWAGDAVFRWETPDGGDGVTVWRTRWISEEEAEEFDYAIARSVAERFPTSEMVGSEEGPRLLRTARRVYKISRTGTDVTVRVASPSTHDRLEDSTAPDKN